MTGIGLAVHLGGGALPSALRDKLGDALWAAMILCWLSALLPFVALGMRALAAFAICSAVELSQLLQAPWLDAIRATRIGHLVLGSGFDARDLFAYAGGVVCAVFLLRRLVGWERKTHGKDCAGDVGTSPPPDTST